MTVLFWEVVACDGFFWEVVACDGFILGGGRFWRLYSGRWSPVTVLSWEVVACDGFILGGGCL